MKLTNTTGHSFHLMAKPIGPLCNLACRYCFYLEKEHLFPKVEQYRMTDAVLETYIKQYIQTQDIREIHFGWQGGEPTLLGVEFYRKVVALQQKYANGKKITNSLQTNGILLDDIWCAFLAEHKFLIGLSIDGPRELHDYYRMNKQHQSAFEQTLRSIELLKKHQVEFNTLTCIHQKNMQSGKAVYKSLKDIGAKYQQYIPIVERKPTLSSQALGLTLAEPPELQKATEATAVTNWSVAPREFGQFLIDIFKEWVEQDVGQVFVQYFDVALNLWVELVSPLCIFAKRCGKSLVIEHNGIIYSCDHYVYPNYALGNILERPLQSLVFSDKQIQFGNDKEELLPKYCRECEVRFVCNGGCPKHRFMKTPDNEPGLNYLCPGYKLFFSYITPYMNSMTQLLRAGRPASRIMGFIAESKVESRKKKGRPNDPCYCGSGKKYKKCCGIT